MQRFSHYRVHSGVWFKNWTFPLPPQNAIGTGIALFQSATTAFCASQAVRQIAFTGHLKLDPRAAVRTVVRCFRVPLSGMTILLSLPETLHAFSRSMKLATSRLGEQKPQQQQDDKVMDELYVEEKHRGWCSF
jgi:hypothetical protein